MDAEEYRKKIEEDILKIIAAEGEGQKVEFKAKMTDLQGELVSRVVLPTLAYGLKPVSKFVGFEYSDEDPGGAQSIAWFEEYQQDPAKNAASRERILTYNREDCEATKLVHEWLAKLCK